jgi:hypothetical protein
MKNLPLGRQDFEAIINEGLLYVDKTRQVAELVDKGRLYFLSRPRRFGKSLLVSLLTQLFSGKKELFKDLYIGKQADRDWTAYPILHFNFAAFGHRVENLEAELRFQLQQYAQQFGVAVSDISLSTQFSSLVTAIAQQHKPVVLLIDEYDKPLIDFLTEMEQAKKNQDVLKSFFSPLKNLEAKGHLRFLFITGVSKFSKISLFSDLNNLTDLTIDPLSDELLGITSAELLSNFKAYIAQAAQHFQMPEEELLEGIKLWYNGYSYNGLTRLYNPFSLLSFFSKRHFGNFWFATGTPTFLVNSIRDRGIAPQEFEDKVVDSAFFEKFSLEELDLSSLLFQTGYLTIKQVRREGFDTRYTLGYPNLEVRRSMMHNLVEAFTFKSTSVVSQGLLKMQDALRNGQVGSFVEQLKIILADIPYHWAPKGQKKDDAALFKMWEGYFHAIIYLLMAYMEVYVQAEIAKHQGRLDLMAETERFLYLMEFKLDEPAEDAIAQIKNREYVAAYRNSTKTIYLVGLEFSRAERNVASWQAEAWERD